MAEYRLMCRFFGNFMEEDRMCQNCEFFLKEACIKETNRKKRK